ncbi:MAG: hypothetical protein ABIJ09_13255 [Pseudomonadota bacterium]
MSERAPHPSDTHLAGLLDGSLRESEALGVRQHLAACVPCEDRLQSLQSVVHELQELPAADEALIVDTLRQVESGRPGSRPAWVWVPAATIPVAAALLLWVWLPRGGEPALVARGGGESVGASVQFEVLRVDAKGTRSTRLHAGECITAAEVSLSVVLHHLPGEGRRAAAYARDSTGRVTWLLPTWPVDSPAPDCLRIPEGAGTIPATAAVTLPGVAPGLLELGLLVFDATCALPALDARLEKGWTPEKASVSGLHQFDHLTIEIASEP